MPDRGGLALRGITAPPARVIPDLLREAAASAPDRLAVAVVGGERLSYGELAERIGRLAAWLASLGVGRGDRIAVRAANGLTFFDAYLAAARLGAACVPVPGGLADAAVEYLLADSRPRLGFADAAGAGALRRCGLDTVVAGSDRHRAALAGAGGPRDAPPAGPDPSDLALIIYTSGTTGRPKGVCLSQAAVCANAAMTAAGQSFTAHEVYLTSTPLYHATAGTRVFTMLDGAHTHVVLRRFDPDAWLEAVAAEGVTTTIAVPTQIRRILDCDRFERSPPSSLRLLVYGAAPSERSLFLRMRDRFPCGLYHGYGLTETCAVVTGFGPEDHRALSGPDDPRLGSVGRAVPGAEVMVRRAGGEPVAVGEVGEIAVRTPKVMTGYWGDTAATAAAFADGWLLTGDLATVDADGYITIVGRSKDVIISGGVNIYPAQVERAIAAHPDVAEVAVFGVPDEDWGQAPAAAVRTKPGSRLTAAQVGDLVAATLDRRARPRRVAFVEDFPRTSTGKIRRTALPELLG